MPLDLEKFKEVQKQLIKQDRERLGILEVPDDQVSESIASKKACNF